MSKCEYADYWNHIWSGAAGDLAPFQLAKYAAVTDAIPEDVQTIVDVGCGSGNFTNRIVDRYKVLGVDFSEAALQLLKCEGRVGDITDLPAGDREFDMSMAMEVLEHMPHDGSLPKAAAELARVARKYVVVTVPANDDPVYYAARCPVCQSRFHESQHMRSFVDEDFAGLIPGFTLVKLIKTGRRVTGSKFLIQLAIAMSPYTGQAREGVPCLICGSLIKTVRIRQSLWSTLFMGLDYALVRLKSMLRIGVPHNFVAIYERAEQ